MKRAYSVLTVKAVDDEKRTIRGVATTPTPDRMGDIVEPLGVSFKNPLALLHQHRSDSPVGTVKFDKPTKAGITFEASLPIILEPGPLKDRVDTAWGEVKAGLVRAVSIGFRPTEYSYMEDGGVRFVECEVLELSLVTIPANADAVISQIRSIDHALLGTPAHEQPDEIDAGRKTKPAPRPGIQAVKAIPKMTPKEGRIMPKSIAEQIKEWEGTRQAKMARLNELLAKSSDAGETLNEEEDQEYETIELELKSVDKQLARLAGAQSLNLAGAKAVDGSSPDAAAKSREGLVVPQVRALKVLPKGLAFSRYVLALARSRGNIMQAAEMVKQNDQWNAETPDVLTVIKAAVAAGSTTDPSWAGPLVPYHDMVQDFAEFLRPLTILGKLNLRNVPFKTRIGRQTGGTSVNWVGEGKVKPLSAGAFDTVTLDFAKIAGIVVLTDETIRFSNPKADEMVRDDLAAAIIQFMDSQFLDPTKAADDVSPASVTNGVTPVTASGTTEAALRADIRSLMATFAAANLGLGDAVWIMSQQQALSIGMMQTALGADSFPGLGVNGGTFMKLPAIVSENVPATGNSPVDGSMIALVKQSEVLLADDGNITIDASREATLQMDSTPDSPATAATVQVSMFQNNMTALRAERFVTWKKRRAGAVNFIQNAKYAE